MKKENLLRSMVLIMGVTLFTACGGGGGSATNTATNTAISVAHNGFTYGFVTSPTTGRVWLDRNLGAGSACNESRDSGNFASGAEYFLAHNNCTGRYFQWGRNPDKHQFIGSSTRVDKALDISDVGFPSFILILPVPHFDWVADGVDNNNTLRIAQWSKTDGSSVCPVAFRVPTRAELSAELAGLQNRDDAYQSFLKIGTSSFRDPLTGDIVAIGNEIFLWTVDDSFDHESAHCIIFNQVNKIESTRSRAFGASVRCIKN
jgi:hypothetical protein